jgi:ubiquinone biosynthesis protein
MMGSLSRRQRESLARLAYSISNGDEKMMTRALLRLTEQDSMINVENLEADISEIYQQYFYLPSGQARLGPALFDMVQILMRYNIRINPRLVWLFKALATAEGTTHRLNVIVDVKEYLKPFARRLLKQNLNPMSHARELPFFAADAVEAIKDSPYEVRDFLRLLKEGNIRIKLEHVGVDPTNKMLARVSTRLVIGILVAALFVGSSLILIANLPPLVGDIPVISLIGFIVAGVLFIWLMGSILSSNGR